MDWSAVALLLAERAGIAAVLLGSKGEIRLIAPAAERALGWSYENLGSYWIGQYVVPEAAHAARWHFDKAVAGALRRFDVHVITAEGTAMATFESCPVGQGDGVGVLLVLEKLVATSHRDLPPDYDYEVGGITTGAFRLRNLWCIGPKAGRGGGTCYEVLHGRPTYCDPCPLRQPENAAGPRVIVRPLGDREYELTGATMMGADQARVSVRRLAMASFSAILQAKLDELSVRARLSVRERDVFGQLIEGATLDEIASKLGIGVRTVKFHQANLLQKLGADSRSDLMRLIF